MILYLIFKKVHILKREMRYDSHKKESFKFVSVVRYEPIKFAIHRFTLDFERKLSGVKIDIVYTIAFFCRIFRKNIV